MTHFVTMRSVTMQHSQDASQKIAHRLINSIPMPVGLVGTGFALSAAILLAWYTVNHTANTSDPHDATATDPGLLKKHSTVESYNTTYGTYPLIRTFYRPHPNAAKLPTDLPLLVFVHGLGGSIAQFAPLLTSISACGPCLAIDFPGCGLSEPVPLRTGAYSTVALAELVVASIRRFRLEEQKIVLIGHSMGGAIAGMLASPTADLFPHDMEQDLISGIIAICPAILPPDPKQLKVIKRLRWLPTSLFDLLRAFDRRGGINSASVTRFVGHDADLETKKLQLRFNEQSKSATFLEMVRGMVPNDAVQQHLAAETWSSIAIPVFLVAGAADHVCPPEHVERIAVWLSKGRQDSGVVPTDAPLPADSGDIEATQQNIMNHSISAQAKNTTLTEEEGSTRHGRALKIEILPAPASHGLLYSGGSVRILSGLIQGFLARHVDNRLSLGWQLQHLTTSGKWDVKNLAKWQSVDPCSEPIAGIFRAMKTMREIDDHHNPKEFVKRFGYDEKTRKNGVCAVIDISHESPVYDPKGLEDAGVEYHKFPTVSKLPPSVDEVTAFIGLIDRLRAPDPSEKPPDSRTINDSTNLASSIGPTGQARASTLHQKVTNGACLALHCHYGFNRTGFFLISYLVESLGLGLQDAINEFADKREPGVKHDYFLDELWVRYGVDNEARLRRRNTLVG